MFHRHLQSLENLSEFQIPHTSQSVVCLLDAAGAFPAHLKQSDPCLISLVISVIGLVTQTA